MKTNTVIRVDLNNKVDGFVLADFGDVTGPIYIGSVVTICGKQDELVGEAMVAHINNDSKRLLLDIDWNSVHTE